MEHNDDSDESYEVVEAARDAAHKLAQIVIKTIDCLPWDDEGKFWVEQLIYAHIREGLVSTVILIRESAESAMAQSLQDKLKNRANWN